MSNSIIFNEGEYNILIEVYALFVELQEAGIFPIEVTFIEFSGDQNADSKKIYDQLSSIKARCVKESAKLRLGSFRSHFRKSLGAAFHYEFSQGDLEPA